MRSCRVPVRGPAVAASTAHANIGTNVFAAVKSSARRNFDWSYMDARSAMAVDARSIMGVHLSLTATFCSSGVSRSEHWPPFSYCRSAARSRLRLQWAAHAPSSAHGHQFPEFFLAAEAERHFADNFIVHVQDGAISGTLDACQRGSRPIDHCCTPIAAAIARARSLSRRPPMPCRRCGAALRRRG